MEAREIYFDFYVKRGETCENRIKELKNMFFSDRLSCHRFWPNFFRLFLSVIVYELFGILKTLLGKTVAEQARRWQEDNLRLFQLKAGATVVKRGRFSRAGYDAPGLQDRRVEIRGDQAIRRLQDDFGSPRHDCAGGFLVR